MTVLFAIGAAASVTNLVVTVLLSRTVRRKAAGQ